MTTLIGGIFGPNPGVDMPNWDLTPLQTGQIAAFGGTSVTIRAGDHSYTLTGHDFAYVVDGGTVSLAAGTITGLTLEPYPPPLTASPLPSYEYQLSDFQLDVGAFNGFVAANDAKGYERALFSGDDHLQGSIHDDHLTGLRGHDHLDGAAGDDILEGGTGNDVLIGGAGADWLSGGRGTDLFVFRGSAESGGGVYDTIDFSTHDDLLVVPHAIAGIDHRVDAGYAESANVDPELAAALDAHHLGAFHAAVATVAVPLGPWLPAFILETFLVVDVNGIAGYQAGEDLAIEIAYPAKLHHLSIDDFISPSAG